MVHAFYDQGDLGRSLIHQCVCMVLTYSQQPYTPVKLCIYQCMHSLLIRHAFSLLLISMVEVPVSNPNPEPLPLCL